ncbi:MAG: hypothetical protein ACYSYL_04265, partial [Planctomycetota bacterium]
MVKEGDVTAHGIIGIGLPVERVGEGLHIGGDCEVVCGVDGFLREGAEPRAPVVAPTPDYGIVAGHGVIAGAA